MHYARITYNTLGYQKPSGAQGKSTDKKTFEGLHGFGWEEWLFNPIFSDAIYRYGFIQGFQDLPYGEFQNIYLLSYDLSKTQWTLKARLAKVEHLDAAAAGLKTHYFDKGLWSTMKQGLNPKQIKEAEALVKNFSNIVNVRFKPENITLYDETFNLKLNYRYGQLVKMNDKLKSIIKTAKIK
jgi:hypothetical protein